MMAAKRLVTALSVAALAGLSSWPAAHAAVAACSHQSRGTAGAPSGQNVAIAGKDGVTKPRTLREVKPRYTAEAQRRHIQGWVEVECVVLADGSVGSARVTRSLDSVYGLDDEALTAARQWRFEPATKDGVPVPATVTIGLGFTLLGAPPPDPAPLAWPDAFPPGGKATSDPAEWLNATLDTDGLRVRFDYPAGWTLRTTGPAVNWFDFVSEDFTRLVVVSRPVRSDAPSSHRLTPAEVLRLAQTMADGFRRSASQAVIHGTGQVKAAGLLWEWTDYSAPAGDPAVPPRFRSRAFGMAGRVRVWHFMARADHYFLGVFFRVAHADGTADANAQAQRQAAAQFAAILARLSFEER